MTTTDKKKLSTFTVIATSCLYETIFSLFAAESLLKWFLSLTYSFILAFVLVFLWAHFLCCVTVTSLSQRIFVHSETWGNEKPTIFIYSRPGKLLSTLRKRWMWCKRESICSQFLWYKLHFLFFLLFLVLVFWFFYFFKKFMWCIRN